MCMYLYVEIELSSSHWGCPLLRLLLKCFQTPCIHAKVVIGDPKRSRGSSEIAQTSRCKQ